MIQLKLRVYEIFKSKFGEEDAATIIEYFEEKAKQKIQQKKEVFITKDDKIDLIKWMVGFWIAQVAAIIGLYIKK